MNFSFLTGGADWTGAAGDLSATLGAAQATGVVGQGEQRSAYSLPTDAIRTMAPVSEQSRFSGLWDVLGGVVNNVAEIELTRYAQNRLTTPGATAPTAAPAAAPAAAPRASTWLLIGGGVLAVGLVAYLALRK
jgi:hypothetical protein